MDGERKSWSLIQGSFSITCLEDKFFTKTETGYLPEYKSNVFPLIETA
jgi:hypothetical protein